jgi:hypothetical protein
MCRYQSTGQGQRRFHSYCMPCAPRFRVRDLCCFSARGTRWTSGGRVCQRRSFGPNLGPSGSCGVQRQQVRWARNTCCLRYEHRHMTRAARAVVLLLSDGETSGHTGNTLTCSQSRQPNPWASHPCAPRTPSTLPPPSHKLWGCTQNELLCPARTQRTTEEHLSGLFFTIFTNFLLKASSWGAPRRKMRHNSGS